MKVRNILIGLLVVLMAFVFISCEDEPAAEPPKPAQVDDTVYKLTATKGISDAVFSHDKFSIWFKEAVEPGATISMEFRSTADYFQMNVRGIGGSPKYVYEEDIKTDGSNSFKLEPLSGGWTKFSYTFADNAADSEDFRVDFRGWILPGDVMELRHVFYDGQQIALSEENMSGSDYAAPTIEVVADHEWTAPKSYTVAYFIGQPDSVDKYPVAEKVAAGGKITKAGLVKENSEIVKIYNYDKSGTKGEEFDENTAINADTFLLVEWKGVDVDITFHKNYLGAEDEALVTTTEFGKEITPPATDDWKREGWKITGWTTEAEATEDNVFDVTNAVSSTDAIELYAQWSNVATLTLNLNYLGAESKDIDVVIGNAPTAAQVGRPGYVLSKWTLGATDLEGTEDDYDFSSIVTEDKTIYAQWTEGTVVKITSKGVGGSDGATGNKVSSYEKIQLEWDFRTVFSDTDAKIEQGDVLAFQFRSERDVYQYDLRTNKKTVPANVDIRWVYEGSGDTSHFVVSDPDANGWRTVTFTFGTKVERDRYPTSSDKRDKELDYTGPDYEHEQYYNLLLCLRANYISGDVFEIKGVSLNGEEVPVISSNVLSSATFVGASDGVIPDTCAVIFVGSGKSGIGYDNDEFPITTKVEAGETVEAPTVTGKVLTFFSDTARTVPFNFSTPITEDTFIYYVMADE